MGGVVVRSSGGHADGVWEQCCCRSPGHTREFATDQMKAPASVPHFGLGGFEISPRLDDQGYVCWSPLGCEDEEDNPPRFSQKDPTPL